ncbi:hypothetical protein AGMMS49992_10630 [Clostridia bacterium]|nr:hypothetical protein AGMMS49992_10630 [Clostridia bacterium]
MTCEQARAVMCLWGNTGKVTGTVKGQIDELTDVMCSLRDSSANIKLTSGGARTCGGGDVVAYKAGLAERFEARVRRLRALMKALAGISAMVGSCLPEDANLVDAMRMREQTRARWTRLGVMFNVDGRVARETHCLVLRRLIVLPWTNRETAAAHFAMRFVPSRAIAGTMSAALSGDVRN